MLDTTRRRAEPSGPDTSRVRSPVQVSLGMMALGAGIACLVFATIGGAGGSTPTVTATVTVTDLAAGAASPQLVPPPPPATTTARAVPRPTHAGSATSAPARRSPAASSARSGGVTKAAAAPSSTASAPVVKKAAVADPSVNLAASQPVRISSHTQDYVAANITDQDVSTYWEAAAGFPQTVTVDLGKVETVGRLVLSLPAISDWNRRTQTIAVAGSKSGSTYTRIRAAAGYTFDANAAAEDTVTVTVPSSRARYLRLTFTANDGWTSAQLSELAAYSS